jgi:8-oxo-dGTP pyrophosphatase MutT (NUDIX family)
VRTFTDASVEELAALLAARPADEIEAPELRRASVLIPLVPSERGWLVLFHRRSEMLRVHRGQIAFPGGGVEEGESVEAAVLRETEEEVGVPAERVRLLGRMDDVVTRTGFLVAPFVGVLPPEYVYVSQPSEVHEIFEVPIAELLSARNPVIRYIEYRGEKFPSYYYLYEQREIWGLTGRILKAFLDVARLAM